MPPPRGASSPARSEESQAELRDALHELEIHTTGATEKTNVSFPTLVEPTDDLEDPTFDLRNCTLARMRVEPPPEQTGKRKAGI
jgi:hypothetical protein